MKLVYILGASSWSHCKLVPTVLRQSATDNTSSSAGVWKRDSATAKERRCPVSLPFVADECWPITYSTNSENEDCLCMYCVVFFLKYFISFYP